MLRKEIPFDVCFSGLWLCTIFNILGAYLMYDNIRFKHDSVHGMADYNVCIKIINRQFYPLFSILGLNTETKCKSNLKIENNLQL